MRRNRHDLTRKDNPTPNEEFNVDDETDEDHAMDLLKREPFNRRVTPSAERKSIK